MNRQHTITCRSVMKTDLKCNEKKTADSITPKITIKQTFMTYVYQDNSSRTSNFKEQ